MTKINLPNSSTTTDNLTSEKTEYLRLYDLIRSSSGDLVFTSTSSGVVYSTLTYLSGAYANQGEEGMLLILQDALEDYLLFAADINTINTNITTLTGSGAVAEKTDLTTFNLHANKTAVHNGGLIYAYNNIGGAL
jgi:hypothetical protein